MGAPWLGAPLHPALQATSLCAVGAAERELTSLRMPTEVVRVAEGAIPNGADGKLTVGYWYGTQAVARQFSPTLVCEANWLRVHGAAMALAHGVQKRHWRAPCASAISRLSVRLWLLTLR